MAIITKPGTITKGQDNSFTLNKADLLAHASVSGDAYFSSDSNWNKVVVVYRTDQGDQKQNVTFDATEVTPTANFSPSSTARDIWQVQSVVIYDFDNGSLFIPRSQLIVAEFDVDLSVIGGPTVVGWELLGGTATISGSNNEILSNTSSTCRVALEGVRFPNDSDWYVEYELNRDTDSILFMIGIVSNTGIPTFGAGPAYYIQQQASTSGNARTNEYLTNPTLPVDEGLALADLCPQNTNTKIKFANESGVIKIYKNDVEVYATTGSDLSLQTGIVAPYRFGIGFNNGLGGATTLTITDVSGAINI